MLLQEQDGDKIVSCGSLDEVRRVAFVEMEKEMEMEMEICVFAQVLSILHIPI